MRSSKRVDQWLIDCDFLRNSPQSIMRSMYLNSRNVFEFRRKLLNNKRSSWNPIFIMMNIISRSLIKKKGVLVERWSKCIKFSGTITLKRKPPGRLKVISINTIRVFFPLPQVPPYLSPFIYPISGRDSF